MDHQQVKDLIEKYLAGEANLREINELNDWYATVDFGDKELDQWIAEEYGMERLTTRMYASFQEKLDVEKRSRIRSLVVRWTTVAASLLILTSMFVLLRDGQKTEFTAKKQVNVIKAGTSTAILTLADGKKIILNTQPIGKIVTQNGVIITKQKNGLVTYTVTPQALSSEKSKNTFNSVETPRGGEFQVDLPDGTKVWLNAATKLEYPTRFAGNQRTVKLSGEAYFEVAHNSRKPFHVLFNGQDVKVLGTHFNINAYPDEQVTKTTLLQGSIALTNTRNKQSVTLTPGQQAASGGASGTYTLQTVNTQQVVSWKNGYFQFDNMNINAVMKALSRWYNIDVKYHQYDTNETFGGTFSRNSNLEDILKNVSALGNVRFQLTGRTIIVSPKKGGL